MVKILTLDLDLKLRYKHQVSWKSESQYNALREYFRNFKLAESKTAEYNTIAKDVKVSRCSKASYRNFGAFSKNHNSRVELCVTQEKSL
jgi:hypothetical protein